jgi:methionine aminotransferase
MRSSIDRVSRAAKALLLLEQENEGIPSALLATHHRRELPHGHGGAVNLSTGSQTGASPPEPVIAAARDALNGKIGGAGQWGLEEFRSAISAKLKRVSGCDANPDTEIIPTIGCQFAIFSSILLLVNPGDEVLIMDPEYSNIAPLVNMVGGRPVYVPFTRTDNGWALKPHRHSDDARRPNGYRPDGRGT